ncbi:M20 metallopeptidase family protein [Fonticella tunisiensis]|uniref:Hippurate hydrolase n=1 Tax=Fonticella tunisiensis TaxID=1096341 RepID=A0A4V3ETM3_9CLOT|nr:amidohydrolase [Fonticella tunisiensis]TDT62874.1 hippurate hydrolase [Fonticella tunisiensis]
MEALLQEIHRSIIEIRRRLHQIPETGFKEFKTSEVIKEKLREYEYEIEEAAQTGIIVRKKGISGRKAIAFRADMDALMVEEKTGVPYASQHQGRMHACGHDGHIAILLGLAMYLSRLETVERDIVLIFQPAEEGPGGAKNIVEEGYLDKYNVEAIFGLHIYPGIEEGKIGIASGPLMAQNGEIDITIHAKSSHGAMPHKGVDGIIIASHLVQAYQSVISRSIDPIDGAVLTIGKIEGGEARNVLAGKVRLEGTMRAFSPEIYNTLKRRMQEINRGLEMSFNCEIELEIRDFYPPVVNDPNLYSIVKDALGDKAVDIRPMMLAEDFSYYQQAIPGFFMMLGAKNEAMGFIHPLHSCYFNFNEDILIHGVEAFIKICRALGAL